MAHAAATAPPVLAVRGMRVHIQVPGNLVRAVDGVDLQLAPGETLGLVGESGSGKTMTAMALMRLLDGPLARAVSGEAWLDGTEILGLSEAAMSELRGQKISMVFQEPMTSLNPVMRIGTQIAEPLVRHLGLSRGAAYARATEMLALVGLPDADRAARSYPHQLSGGMRQRAMIAIALACRPAVLIADEPTTALDVTIQAQILALMATLQRELGTAILLITHDLAVIAETAHRVAVMYAGRIVEQGPVEEIFANPRHPYTQGLLASIPRIERVRSATLHEIPGGMPDISARRSGCSFQPRCRLAGASCATAPDLAEIGPGHHVACWHHDVRVAIDA